MNTKKNWIRAILALPFNVMVTIPCLILCFSDYEYAKPPIVSLIFGMVFLFAGLFLVLWTVYLFHKIGKGTLAPWAPTQHLIVEGPYKVTRNPMSTGVLFILLAEALIGNATPLFYYAALFLVLSCVYYVRVEEKQLEKQFGDEFLDYKKRVPMIIPFL